MKNNASVNKSWGQRGERVVSASGSSRLVKVSDQVLWSQQLTRHILILNVCDLPQSFLEAELTEPTADRCRDSHAHEDSI